MRRDEIKGSKAVWNSETLSENRVNKSVAGSGTEWKSIMFIGTREYISLYGTIRRLM